MRGTLQSSVGAGGNGSNNSTRISNFRIGMIAFHWVVKRFRVPLRESIASTDMDRLRSD
jgi:hypothetical protein